MNKPEVLLNMIVKNEAHVIESTFDNLLEKVNITYWVISDTGSTDGTQEVIKNYFNKKNIKGELFQDEWRDFGYNRTKALEHAYNKSDLLLVFDADDGLTGEFVIPENYKEFDTFHLKFGGKEELNYWRICMVNNRRKWRYVGVLHEYIDAVDQNPPTKHLFLIGDYHVIHRTTGGRSQDVNKYKKDAAILEKAFNELGETDTLRNRYAFYCANSYKDDRNYDKAIEWYTKTINLNGGWQQEKYRSCIMLYEFYKLKGEMEKALYYALQSVKFDNTRVEGIYRLVQYYASIEMFDVAMNFYNLVKDWFENNYYKLNNPLADKLFIDILDYDFYLPYHIIISAAKMNKLDIVMLMYKIIFDKKKIVHTQLIDNILQIFNNLQKVQNNKNFIEDFKIRTKDYLDFLEKNKIKVRESFYENVFDLNKKKEE
jgi:tetratricopeptide (TPR) repeat protein